MNMRGHDILIYCTVYTVLYMMSVHAVQCVLCCTEMTNGLLKFGGFQAMTATDEICQMLQVLKLHALILGPDSTL